MNNMRLARKEVLTLSFRFCYRDFGFSPVSRPAGQGSGSEVGFSGTLEIRFIGSL